MHLFSLLKRFKILLVVTESKNTLIIYVWLFILNVATFSVQRKNYWYLSKIWPLNILKHDKIETDTLKGPICWDD